MGRPALACFISFLFRWYGLLCKPGQNKTKPRGELEVRLAFEVKKVKDLDSMSTASATSKRFKMSKKSIKQKASAIGEGGLLTTFLGFYSLLSASMFNNLAPRHLYHCCNFDCLLNYCLGSSVVWFSFINHFPA